MGFKKGEGGRQAGATNITTRLVKEVFNDVFTDLQSHPTANLKTWAASDPGEFYKLASKLIPAQMNIAGDINHSLMTLDPFDDPTADNSTSENSVT